MSEPSPKTHNCAPRSMTRRGAIRLAIGAGAGACTSLVLPALAMATGNIAPELEEYYDDSNVTVSEEDISEAEAEAEAAQAQLDIINAEYADIAAQLSQTQASIVTVSGQIATTEANIVAKQAEIDAKQAEIDAKQAEIDAKQAEIERTQETITNKQETLGNRMSAAYKAGKSSSLDVLLSSATFTDLVSNIFYLDKISQADSKVISEIKVLKAELEIERADLEDEEAELEIQRIELEIQEVDLEDEKAELESEQSQLESLRSQQESQLLAAEAKQVEAEDLVANLNAEVQDLITTRDAELKEAEEMARRAREEALANARIYGSTAILGNGSLSDVVAAAYSTPSTGAGLCAAWVSNVFRNAGVGSFSGNACDLYYWYCGYSTSSIQPGMIIAVNTCPYSYAAILYGHVGIYIGDGLVRDNASGVLRTTDLSEWISQYSVTATVLCGWLGGIYLS